MGAERNERFAAEIERAKDSYATDHIGVETLEAEVEFWTEAMECERCDHDPGQLCSTHYGQLVGR